MSCLNLYYSVKFKAKKALKDEKKDQTAPIVLSNITDQDSDSEAEEGELSFSLSLSLSLSPSLFSLASFPSSPSLKH